MKEKVTENTQQNRRTRKQATLRKPNILVPELSKEKGQKMEQMVSWKIYWLRIF